MLSARFAAASGRSVLVGELAVARHKRPGKQEAEENLGSLPIRSMLGGGRVVGTTEAVRRKSMP